MLIENIKLYGAYDGVGQIITACDLFFENDYIVSAYAPLTKKICFSAQNDLGHSYIEQEILLKSLLVGKEPNIVSMDQLLEDTMLNGSTEVLLNERICFAASSAVCKANAIIENMSYYEFFSCLTGMYDLSLPIPVVTLFINKNSLSFLCVKYYSIIPSSENVTLGEAHRAIFYIYFLLRDLMHMRNIPFFINDNGIYEVCMSEINIGDLLMLAIEKTEAIYGVLFGMGLSFSAQDAYHHALKLYKLSNQMGTIDDVVEYYKEFLNRYPVTIIEDGAVLGNHNDWNILHKEFPSPIVLIKDFTVNAQPENLWNSLGEQHVQAVMLGVNGVPLVTSLIQSIQYCRDKNILIGIRGAIIETIDDFLIDLAVGTHAAYVHVGGIGRGEYNNKYNRLRYIESEIYDQCK